MNHYSGTNLNLRKRLLWALVLVLLCVPVRISVAQQQAYTQTDLIEAIKSFIDVTRTGDFKCITVPVPGYVTLRDIFDELNPPKSEFNIDNWDNFKQCAADIHHYPNPSNFASVSMPYIQRIDAILGYLVPGWAGSQPTTPLVPSDPLPPVGGTTVTPETEGFSWQKILDGGMNLIGSIDPEHLKKIVDIVDVLVDKPSATPTTTGKPDDPNNTTLILLGIAAAVIIGILLLRKNERDSGGRSGGRGRSFDDNPFGGDDDEDFVFADNDFDAAGNARRRPRSAESFSGTAPTNAGYSGPHSVMNEATPAGDPYSMLNESLSGIALTGLTGNYVGQRIPLRQFPAKIGRGSGSAVVIRDYVKGVSRDHCLIRFSRSNNAYLVVDSGSTYGTYVNNTKLEKGKPVILKSGDVISLGSKNAAFRVDL